MVGSELNRSQGNEGRLKRFISSSIFSPALYYLRLEQAKITKTQKANFYI